MTQDKLLRIKAGLQKQSSCNTHPRVARLVHPGSGRAGDKAWKAGPRSLPVSSPPAEAPAPPWAGAPAAPSPSSGPGPPASPRGSAPRRRGTAPRAGSRALASPPSPWLSELGRAPAPASGRPRSSRAGWSKWTRARPRLSKGGGTWWTGQARFGMPLGPRQGRAGPRAAALGARGLNSGQVMGPACSKAPMKHQPISRGPTGDRLPVKRSGMTRAGGQRGRKGLGHVQIARSLGLTFTQGQF